MTGPKAYHGIMVSSTFSDLEGHRSDVIDAIEKLGFHANVMEVSGAQADTDVIDTSIRMVRDSVAYVGLISHRYGQTPPSPDRNPDGLSITELEFNEAMKLGRPILLFLMDDKHPVTKADIEQDPEKIAKLECFRERAKKMRDGSDVERIYEVFDSRENFARSAITATGLLTRKLSVQAIRPDSIELSPSSAKSIEAALAPDLRAVPHYLGSHSFVGRASELETLDDWCVASDPHPMLLFEAIGGSGKSMVTWTWLTQHASNQRQDWAGRFWFSFYEGGATMQKFCREALAYMTGAPDEELRKQPTSVLVSKLRAELDTRPWLLVLDGLERILVAYHRIDAAQMREEEVETAEDQIANRDPCDAINPEDEDLLRLMTGAGRSKVLVTSRLTPRVLFNRSGTPMPGVRREILQGLRSSDAEALFRACGVKGDSQTIREYLQRNCDRHPLVIGALAGLVNNFLPDRGNFDAWLADPAAGGKLDLADLDLTQRRNHILDAAITALSAPSRKLLQTLSLLQTGTDYQTLKAFNPHLPPAPDEVEEPIDPEKGSRWRRLSKTSRERSKANFEIQKERRATYLAAYKAWEQSPAVQIAPMLFDETLTDLEKRGLLQYDFGLKQYDLHPVVRGVAAGRMNEAETDELGAAVVDHFSSRPHDPWEQAQTLEDLNHGIQLVTTLTRMGKYAEALNVYRGDLARALLFNLSAHREVQRILRPFFPDGWSGPIALSRENDQIWLLADLSIVLRDTDPHVALAVGERYLSLSLSLNEASYVHNPLSIISVLFDFINKRAAAFLVGGLALELAEVIDNDEIIFVSLQLLYVFEASFGRQEQADQLWKRLDPMGRKWDRSLYRGGSAESYRARDLFWRGELTEEVLALAERMCREDANRYGIIRCALLRGEWHLSRDEPALALQPLAEGMRLYRESGLDASIAEALLALARLRTQQESNGREIAERLDEKNKGNSTLYLAELWRELGAPDRAIKAALRAYKYAYGDGEPYVHRNHLNRAEKILRELGRTPPEVPHYDTSKGKTFEWESDVRALIKKTREEREEKDGEKDETVK